MVIYRIYLSISKVIQGCLDVLQHVEPHLSPLPRLKNKTKELLAWVPPLQSLLMIWARLRFFFFYRWTSLREKTIERDKRAVKLDIYLLRQSVRHLLLSVEDLIHWMNMTQKKKYQNESFQTGLSSDWFLFFLFFFIPLLIMTIKNDWEMIITQ